VGGGYNRNTLIDIFRLPCAILVVFVHTYPFIEINPTVDWVINEYLGRVAVPFFFAIFSFYYIKRLLAGKEVKSLFLKLLRIYLIWTVISLSFGLILRFATDNFKPRKYFLKTLFDVFVFGSKYQLWFFPALFISLGLITLMHKLKILKPFAYFSFALYVLGLLGGIYYKLGDMIPIVSEIINFKYFYKMIHRIFCLGLPFSLMGYFLNVFFEKHKKNNKKYLILLSVVIVLFFAESILADVFSIAIRHRTSIMLYPLMFILIVLFMDNPSSNPKTIRFSEVSKDISYFMYYSHPFFINILQLIDYYVVAIPYFHLASFAITLILTITIGFVISKENKKYLNFFIK